MLRILTDLTPPLSLLTALKNQVKHALAFSLEQLTRAYQKCNILTWRVPNMPKAAEPGWAELLLSGSSGEAGSGRSAEGSTVQKQPPRGGPLSCWLVPGLCPEPLPPASQGQRARRAAGSKCGSWGHWALWEIPLCFTNWVSSRRQVWDKMEILQEQACCTFLPWGAAFLGWAISRVWDMGLFCLREKVFRTGLLCVWIQRKRQ